MSSTVLIKLRKNKSFPGIGVKQGNVVEVMLGTLKDTEHVFIDSLEDVPDGMFVSINFPNGSGTQIPVETFKYLFVILPKGELTGVLYE